MIGSVLVVSALLAGQTAAPSPSGDRPKTAPSEAAHSNPQKARAQYHALKEKTPEQLRKIHALKLGAVSIGTKARQ